MNHALRNQIAAGMAQGLRRMQDQATARTPMPAAVAMQAALRRGAAGGFGHDARADAALLAMLHLPTDDEGRQPPLDYGLSRALDDAGLIATLVASTRVTVYEPARDGERAHRNTRSFGSDLRVANARRSSGVYEDLLLSLLRADRADLARQLRRAFTLMRTDGIRVDACTLFFDLGDWSVDSGEVQKRWAYHFWSSSEGHATDTSNDDKEQA